MNDIDKSKAQLIEELESARSKVDELQKQLFASSIAVNSKKDLFNILYHFIDSSLLAEIWRDDYGEIIYVTPAIEELIKFTPEDFFNKSVQLDTLLTGSSLESYKNALKEDYFQTYSSFHSNIIDKNGDNILIDFTIQKIFDKSDRLIGYKVILQELDPLSSHSVFSEERYKKIFEISSDSIVLGDLKGRIILTNAATAEIFGYSSSKELIGVNAFELFADESLENARKLFESVLKGISLKNIPLVFKKIDGTKIHGELSSIIYKDKNGLPVGTLSFMRDVTAQKKREEESRNNELRYKIIAEQTGQIVYDWDVQNGSINWAGAIQQLSGFSAEAYQKMDFNDWLRSIHPEDRDRVKKAINQAADNDDKFFLEYRLLKRNGSYIYVEDNGVFIKDTNCDVIRLLGSLKDITERKLAEKALKDSENKYRALIDTTDTGYVILDTDGRVIDANNEICSTYRTCS